MKNFLLPLIICFFLSAPLASYATHASGIELRYEHLSGDTFRFHFILFRDCNGIPGNAQYQIEATSVCGDHDYFTVNFDSIVNVSQICASVVDRCVDINSPNMGIEAWYYHGEAVLTSHCSSWTFGITPICNRNNAITNVLGYGGSWCSYIEAKLNNLDAPDNNSPVLTALPLFHLCNQVQYVHLYAQDPDGDSLTFEMYNPHSDQLTDVQYVNGLSAYQPVTYTFPDSTWFDPVTGDIRFKANNSQVTIVAVRVNEFRNGIFIGSEERDIEVIFSSCTEHAPTATGINQSASFISHVCADSLLEFTINVSDIDGDSVRTSWQNNIPGSSIVLSGLNNQILTFNWQPSVSDISPVPYTFTLYVTDSSCPYVYYNSYQYHIYVDSCFAVTGIDNADREESVLKVFPNPATETINVISNKSESLSEAEISIYNMFGVKIYSAFLRERSAIRCEHFPSGLYYLEISTSGKTLRTKFVKQ